VDFVTYNEWVCVGSSYFAIRKHLILESAPLLFDPNWQIIWWPNIISNKVLRKATGQEGINLEIRKRKFRWIGHALRKEDGEITKAALLCNPQGSRKRGRRKNSCRRSVIKEADRNWNETKIPSS
jgi:hypothetical protein